MSWGSFITTLNTDKNRKSEKESAERHRVMHMEVPLLTSTAIASFHIHLLLSHSSSPPFAEEVNSKGLCLACHFLKIPVKLLCCSWKMNSTLRLPNSPVAQPSSVGFTPPRSWPNTDRPQVGELSHPHTFPMFSFQQSKQACSDHWILQNLLVNEIEHCNDTRLAYEGKTQLGLDGWWVLSSRCAN